MGRVELGEVEVNEVPLVTNSFRLKADYGQWLQTDWVWDWFGHFTFRGEVSSVKADKEWKYFIKQIQKMCGRSVQWVRATELQQREVIHYHALFLNIGKADRFLCMNIWDDIAGFARVYLYDKAKGAGYYLSKYCVKELGEIKFSARLQEYAVWSDRYDQLKLFP